MKREFRRIGGVKLTDDNCTCSFFFVASNLRETDNFKYTK